MNRRSFFARLTGAAAAAVALKPTPAESIKIDTVCPVCTGTGVRQYETATCTWMGACDACRPKDAYPTELIRFRDRFRSAELELLALTPKVPYQRDDYPRMEDYATYESFVQAMNDWNSRRAQDVLAWRRELNEARSLSSRRTVIHTPPHCPKCGNALASMDRSWWTDALFHEVSCRTHSGSRTCDWHGWARYSQYQ